MNDQQPLALRAEDALILVDVQNDFLPGGALAVPDGDQVVPVLNRYLALFRQRQLPLFATRDWHPPNHCSFQARGGIWPVHCVRHSHGAEFSPGLQLAEDVTVISKADRAEEDAYSGFAGTDLSQRLQALGCQRLFIGGLATDYCVLNTVLDGLQAGFRVVLLEDGVRAVNLKPDDGAQAIRRMQQAGALRIRLEALEDATP